MNRHRSIAVLLCAALLSGCNIFDDSAVQELATAPILTTARIKFHNFSPSSVGVDFFSDGVKMSAVLSGSCSPLLPTTADTIKAKCAAAGIEATTGVGYGTCTAGVCTAGPAAGGLYSAITAGAHTLVAKMAAKDTVVATVTQTIDNNKYYSFFMSGIYNTTSKTAEAFVVEDPIPATIDYTVAHVRLVNAISNGTTDLNLFVQSTATGSTETAVGGAVVYKAAGTFVTVPVGTYDIRVRYTGVGTNLIARTTLSLLGGRVYTITSRGSTATAATLGLDFTQNNR